MIDILELTISTNSAKITDYLTKRFTDCRSCDKNIVICREKYDIDYIINALSESITEFFEKKIIYSLIKENYCYYSESERNSIYSKTVNYINDEGYEFSKFYRESRNDLIKSKLYEYLADNDSINIDGFIIFRLKEYTDELLDIISASVEEFIIDKEYDEFVSLMKYYISLQKTIYKRIDIVFEKSSFCMYDENGTDVTRECMRSYLGVGFEAMFRLEDLLLNALITVAPETVVLHMTQNIGNDEIINTLKKIFDDSIRICCDCAMCHKISEKQ